jgi:MFS family permease
VFGRRVIGATLLVPGMALVALVYVSSGATVWLVGFLGTAFAGAVGPALAVFGPELFPSAIRNRANGGINIVQVVGSVIGLQIAGRFSDAHDRLAPGMFLLLVGPAVAAVLVWRCYPETTRRELEELNPEDEPAPDQHPGHEPEH